jgi:hypothetical protein
VQDGVSNRTVESQSRGCHAAPRFGVLKQLASVLVCMTVADSGQVLGSSHQFDPKSDVQKPPEFICAAAHSLT